MPKAAPVTRSTGIDSREIDIIGAEREITVGDVLPSHEPVIDIPGPQDSMEREAFMQEEMVIEIAPPQSKSESNMVFIGHNVTGAKWVPRNTPIRLRRCDVAILCNAKASELKQNKQADEEGFESYRDFETTHLAYPFRVIEDANPRGAAWLRAQLAKPY